MKAAPFEEKSSFQNFRPVRDLYPWINRKPLRNVPAPNSNAKIVGGEEARPHSWPHVVSKISILIPVLHETITCVFDRLLFTFTKATFAPVNLSVSQNYVQRHHEVTPNIIYF